MVTPEGRRTVTLPTYAEIRLALFPGRSVSRELDAFDPDCVHIATEGTLGLAARNYCRRRQLPFTTTYHTQFPEYVRARADSDRLDSLAIALVSPTCRAHHGADITHQGETGEA